MNFSIVYGISDFGLARDLGVSGHARPTIISPNTSRTISADPAISRTVWSKQAYRDGYVETLLGRRRYMTELKSPTAACVSLANGRR